MHIEEVKTFQQGMNRDVHPINVPANAYTFMLNGVEVSKERDLTSRTNERGNVSRVNIGSSSGFKVIGETILNEDIILFLVNPTTGESEIGIYNEPANTYTAKVNNTIPYVNAGQDLNFSVAHQVDAVARISFNNQRLIYFTDDFNPPRVLNLDKIPTSNIGQSMSLFGEYNIPIVSLNSIAEGDGSIKCGVYQFAVRYLTSSLDATGFGIISNPIPVVDDLRSAGRNAYDGNFNTVTVAKSIKLDISNIDQDYKFFEVAVLFYDGVTNVLVSRVFARRDITAATASVTYEGDSAGDTEILPEEITAAIVSYDKVKCVEQKDNRLFLSNLEATADFFDFQTIANNIRTAYTVKEVEFQEQMNLVRGTNTYASNTGGDNYFGDFKDEKNTFDSKTYMREEVYSLAIVFLLKSGARTFAYHIPGTSVTSTTSVDSTGFGVLGTYVSTETYPSGQSLIGPGAGYVNSVNRGTGPQVVANTNVRHHKMPSLTQEPHFRVDGTTGKTYIRLLGLNFSNIIIPASIVNKLQGYMIVRQQRDTTNNTSIVAQGLAQPIIDLGKTASSPEGYMTVSYMFGHTRLGAGTRVRWQSSNNADDINELNWVNNMVGFYGPDVILNKIPTTGVNTIKPVLTIQGKPKITAWHSNLYDNNLSDSINGKGGAIHALCNYDTVLSQVLPTSSSLDLAQYALYGGYWINGVSISGFPRILSNYENEGYLLLKSPSAINVTPNGGSSINRIQINLSDSDDATHDTVNGKEHPGGSTVYDMDLGIDYRYIYNLINTNTHQYGPITDGSYVYVKHTLTPASTTLTDCFNGDTFISKFAFKNSANIVWTNKPCNNCSYISWTTQDSLRGINPGMELKGLAYFFVESKINCNYRHRITNGVPYFPNTKIITEVDAAGNVIPTGKGVLDVAPSLGEATAYNTQYSQENNVTLYEPKPLGFVSVGDFPNRTVYSQQASGGDVDDKYKVFLVNNFHDVPKNTGEIWDTFVLSGTFYHHTPKSLWRSFVNEREQILTSEDQITIGSGGVFAAPSKEVITIDGGYAGCESQWAGVNAPFGRLFPDINQRKVFLLADSLREVTADGLSRFIDNEGGYNSNLVKDNPANPAGMGYAATYDFSLNRYILTKRDGDSSFTVSYSPLSKSWVSYHDYKPSVYISKGNRVYSFNNTLSGQLALWEHNAGNFGSFYGQVFPFIIEFSINSYAKEAKDFYSMAVLSESTNLATTNTINLFEDFGTLVREDTFNSMLCYNNLQSTGNRDLRFIRAVDNTALLPNEVSVRYLTGQYNVHIPRNAVVNANLNIFDPANISLSTKFKDRMHSKYLLTRLTYNNNSNYKLVVNAVKAYFRKYYH